MRRKLMLLILRKLSYLQQILEEMGRKMGVDLAKLCNNVDGLWVDTCIMPEEEEGEVVKDGG